MWQGLNFIAGFLCLRLEDDEAVFEIFSTLLDDVVMQLCDIVEPTELR